MDGRLKDRAVGRLLKKLAAQHSSLCIISSRIPVHDISDRPHVQTWPLHNLHPADGVALLQSQGVKGTPAELEKAVGEYGCHALALHLLGNAVATYLNGDIRKRDTLDALLDEDAYSETERHAFKVMQAYQGWLTGEDGKPTPELQLLRLLGLFDHPIETEVLEVLWQAQIAGLSDDIPLKAWQNAIRNLRYKHRLLASHEGRVDLLDCHPLIREYFGKQLQTQQPEAWRQAHERLYEYYKALPKKELPETLEEMQPLFNAVAHGCAAGLHEQAVDDVYWPRILQEHKHFLTKKLGAVYDDLACVAHFFKTPWNAPAESLTLVNKAAVLNWSGFLLRALGRIHAALDPIQVNIEINERHENWKSASINMGIFSELQLTLV